MNTFKPKTIILGATPVKDRHGRHMADRKGRAAWNLPEPIRREPHWINRGRRLEAEAKGLDRMTAGPGYTFMVPIYRGMPSKVYSAIKNRSRRKNMGRWSS